MLSLLKSEETSLKYLQDLLALLAPDQVPSGSHRVKCWTTALFSRHKRVTSFRPRSDSSKLGDSSHLSLRTHSLPCTDAHIFLVSAKPRLGGAP